MADEQGTVAAVESGPENVPATESAAESAREAPKSSTSASRRVRARLARRMTSQRAGINPVLEPLVAVHREIHPKADLALLQRAYAVAEERHADAVAPFR